MNTADSVAVGFPTLAEFVVHYPSARVLVVEDQLLNRHLLFDLLGYVSIVPVMAEDGLEALNILREGGPGSFDLVLMDVQMPVMDGITATREIRALPGCATLPIVAMTAHLVLEKEAAYLAAGMNDHIGKPFTLPDFFGMLARWLEPDSFTSSGHAGAFAGKNPLTLIRGLDFRTALQRFAGNIDRLHHWLGVFVVESANFSADIRHRRAQGDDEGARHAVQSFRSRVGTLGMGDLDALTSGLERMMASGISGPDVELQLERLSSEIEAMRVSVAAALDQFHAAIAAAEAASESGARPHPDLEE